MQTVELERRQKLALLRQQIDEELELHIPLEEHPVTLYRERHPFGERYRDFIENINFLDNFIVYDILPQGK